MFIAIESEKEIEVIKVLHQGKTVHKVMIERLIGHHKARHKVRQIGHQGSVLSSCTGHRKRKKIGHLIRTSRKDRSS